MQHYTSIRNNFYPFLETRAPKSLRSGILTLEEKWHLLVQKGVVENSLFDDVVCLPEFNTPIQDMYAGKDLKVYASFIQHPRGLLHANASQLNLDFFLLTQERISSPIPEGVFVRNREMIFIEPGAKLWGCTINAEAGPVYIGSNAEVMEGANLRGPLSIGSDAVVKMGTRIYGATTIGPSCTVGGEIKNSIIMGFSNKGHDGYLGDSIIGEWCNLGAGCSNSNIKNSAGEVKVWNQVQRTFEAAGQKCGLLMGDYSRAAINTSFNTGTVVGVGANVFGSGLTPKFIPDFSWGWENNQIYRWEALIRDLKSWKKLKNKTLSAEDIRQLESIFAKTQNNP